MHVSPSFPKKERRTKKYCSAKISDMFRGVGLLDHLITLFLVSRRTAIMFSMSVPSYIPTSSVQGFSFLHILPTFVICSLFDDDHSDRCQVITYWDFDLHFSSDW